MPSGGGRCRSTSTARFLTLRAAMRAMIAGGKGGSIVLVSSAAGLKAEPGVAAYGASKAALLHLAKVAAKEGAAHRIRVNAIAPAGVETPVWRRMDFFNDLVAEHGGEQAAFDAMAAMATPWAPCAPARRAAPSPRLARVDRHRGAAAASRSITGTTRAISSPSHTACAPGRVDSPPTSTIAAPAAAIATPASAALAGSSRCAPPSEKLSGVMLRMPRPAADRAGSCARRASSGGRASGDLRAPEARAPAIASRDDLDPVDRDERLRNPAAVLDRDHIKAENKSSPPASRAT